MNPMQLKSPEERRAIAAKGHATRRARIERDEAARRDAIVYRNGLREEIARLEQRVAELHRAELFGIASANLTGKALLRAEEIADGALPWVGVSGIYFLLKGSDVVYVGQSVNVYARISQHAAQKQFDRYAFVQCPTHALDVLESLYIHCLRPPLNGDYSNGGKQSPVRLEHLLSEIGNREGQA